MWPKLAVIALLLVLVSPLRAEPLPDASFKALVDRSVALELDDGRTAGGRLLAFDADTLTLVAADSGEISSVARARVVRVRLVTGAVAELAPPPRPRMWDVQLSLPGSLNVDVDRGYLHAFASGSFLLPILTGAGQHTWFGFSAGAGIAVPVTEHWKLDAFAVVMPLRYTSFYTYLATGLGIGAHFTGRSGMTFGVALPLLGFAARLGHSPYGYDAPFRTNDSLGYFYFAGITALPLVSVGYRFPCPCHAHAP